MTEQRPSFVPGVVLAQVSLRVVLPLLGGVIAGMVADGLGQTSPQFALIGLAGGTLVSILWLRAFIVSGAKRLRGEERDRASAAGAEEHEHTTTEHS